MIIRRKGTCGVFAGNSVWSTSERLEVVMTIGAIQVRVPFLSFLNEFDHKKEELNSLFNKLDRHYQTRQFYKWGSLIVIDSVLCLNYWLSTFYISFHFLFSLLCVFVYNVLQLFFYCVFYCIFVLNFFLIECIVGVMCFCYVNPHYCMYLNRCTVCCSYD